MPQGIISHVGIPIELLRIIFGRHHRIRADEPAKRNAVKSRPIIIQAPQRRSVLLPLPGETAIRRHTAAGIAGPRLTIGIILHLADLGPARAEGEARAAEMIAGEVGDRIAATGLLPHGHARAAREVVTAPDLTGGWGALHAGRKQRSGQTGAPTPQ